MNRALRALRATLLVALGTTFLSLGLLLRFATERACVDARYAHHLGMGLGPRFNPDDAPLEGFSSPALAALGALAEALGIPALPAMQAVGLTAGVLLIAVVYRDLTGWLEVRPGAALTAVATLAVSPAVAAWATGRPETLPSVLAAWIVFSAAMVGHRGSALGAGLALVGLHDHGVWIGLGLAGVAAVWRLLESARWNRPLPRTARPPALQALAAPLVAAVGMLGLAGALAGLRMAVFGDPVPWYVRQLPPADAIGGAWYVLGAAVGSGLPLVWLAGLWPSRRIVWPLAAGVALAAAGAVISGGESDPFARLLLLAAPFGTCALALQLSDQADRGHRLTVAGLAGIALTLAHLPAWDVPLGPRRVRQAVDLRPETARTRTEIAHWRFVRAHTEEGLALGRMVREVTGPDTTWVVGSPGARGLASGLHVFDLSGTVDPRAFAARRGERAPRAIFLDRDPTLLRARVATSADQARVIAIDWAADNPDYSPRVVELDGSWLVLQER